MHRLTPCLLAGCLLALPAVAEGEVATFDLGSSTVGSTATAIAVGNDLAWGADWYELSFDWSAVANDPWSAEALFALADGPDIDTAMFYTEGTSRSSAARIDGSPRTLTWGALLDTSIPAGEDFWFLARQNGADRQAQWDNISLVLATADEVNTGLFAGDTTGGPTFHRPLVNLNGPSDSGQNVPYEATGFTVTADGIYNLFSDDGDFDGVIYLYQDSFDPANPLDNVMGASDWPGTSPFYDQNAELNALFLEAGRDYIFVQTGFEDSDAGAYTVTVRSIAGQIVIPEPATAAMVLVAGAFLLCRRR